MSAAKPSQERRSPERHRVMLALMRRVAAYSLALAVALLVVPRLLLELGVLGPDASERVAGAQRALDAARTYGADAGIPALAAAEAELHSAQRLQRTGHLREARHAADRAQRLAAQAQQAALVRKDAVRLQAKKVVDEIDERVEELEQIYADVTRGMPKARVSELFSLMKRTRASAAALVLAWEQGDYARVVEGRDAAVAVLEVTKKELQAAGS